VRVPLHGSEADAEQPCRLLLRESEVVAGHDDLALPGGQGLYGSGDTSGLVAVDRAILERGRVDNDG